MTIIDLPRHHDRLLASTIAAGCLLITASGCSSTTASTPTTPTTPSPPTTVAMSTVPTAVDPPTTVVVTTPAPTSSPSTTPETDVARAAMLSDVLEAHLAAGEFVGARMAIRDSSGAITQATAGTTSLDPDSAAVDPDVPWNIGSVTKTFVAVVVLQLAEEGRLDLDVGIEAYLPDLPDAARITPRQLLQHTTGLGEYDDQPAVLDDLRRAWTPAELIAVAEAAGRVDEPGLAYHYANTNYIVLGEIVAQVTGHSWSDEVRTRIIEPLALSHTDVITDQQPVGYTIADDGSFIDSTDVADPSVGGAAGALLSTERDLLRFVTALADGTLLSADSLAAMQTFVPGEDYSQFGVEHGYGLGLEQYRNDAITVVGHLGTGAAQSAFVGWDTRTRSAIAVMTNTAVGGPQGVMAIEALTADAALR